MAKPHAVGQQPVLRHHAKTILPHPHANSLKTVGHILSSNAECAKRVLGHIRLNVTSSELGSLFLPLATMGLPQILAQLIGA
jgi:hypothetical protein